MSALDVNAPRPFDDAAFYSPDDAGVVSVLGSPSSQANRRSRGDGPRWCKLAGRVRYPGSALNAYVAQQLAAGVAEQERRSGDRPAA